MSVYACLWAFAEIIWVDRWLCVVAFVATWWLWRGLVLALVVYAFYWCLNVGLSRLNDVFFVVFFMVSGFFIVDLFFFVFGVGV